MNTELVRAIIKDAVNITTCDINTIKEFSLNLWNYDLLTISDAEVVSEIQKFIYNHNQQDSIINFIYETYLRCLENGVDKKALGELAHTATEFLNSKSLDSEYSKIILEGSINDDNGSDIFLNVIRFLRCYLPILDDQIVIRFNKQ